MYKAMSKQSNFTILDTFFMCFPEQLLPVESKMSQLKDLERTLKEAQILQTPKPELLAPKCVVQLGLKRKYLVLHLNCFTQMDQQWKQQCAWAYEAGPALLILLIEEVGRVTSTHSFPHRIQVLPNESGCKGRGQKSVSNSYPFMVSAALIQVYCI